MIENTSSQTLRGIIICSLAAFFYVYDYFIQVSPSVMTHQLMQEFNINAIGLSVLGACFYYAYAAMQIPAGVLLDRLGARHLLTFSVLISAAGVTLFALTPFFWLAGVARLLIGLGSAFAFISTLFLASRWFSSRYFAMIAGLVQLGGCLGSLVGQAPLAKLVSIFGWRNSMLMIGIATFFLSLIFWLVIRDTDKSKSVLAKPHSVKSPLYYLLKHPQILWVALCGLLCWVPVTSVAALWGIPYLTKVFAWNDIQAAKIIAFFWIGLGVGSPIIGWFSNKIQRRRLPLLLCFAIGAIASIALLNVQYFNVIGVAIILFFLGMSASVQSMSFGLIQDITPPAILGLASGINNMGALIGGAIAQSLLGFLLTYHWQGHKVSGIASYSISNYHFALSMLPISALLGFAISLFLIQETRCRLQSSDIPCTSEKVIASTVVSETTK